MDTPRKTEPLATYDVAVLGAGYAGLMAALRLRRSGRRLNIALVNAGEAFLERVRLQETIIAAVPARLPSISALVAGTTIDFIPGRVMALDAQARRVRIANSSEEREIGFHEAVYALGSTIDTGVVPGVAALAYRLEAGDGPRSAAALRARLRENSNRPLRIVTVGGAETGVEVAGEIKTAWPRASVTMISRSRCGDFKGTRVERAVRAALEDLDVALVDGETVSAVRAADIVTASGRTIACDICVWSGGLASSPLARTAGLATDAKGRIWVDATLRSITHPHIFAVGDAAHPIAPTGAPYRLSAFAALVSGAYVADAIVAAQKGEQPRPFSFSTFGQGIAIGRGGVGFASYPDDQQRFSFVFTGRTARYIRNFFVQLLTSLLKVERRFPGFFFWPGRRRVSWHQANEAIQKQQTRQLVQAT